MACLIFVGATYASAAPGNGSNPIMSKPIKTSEGKYYYSLSDYLSTETAFWCSYAILVFKGDIYTGVSKIYTGWITTEADCDEMRQSTIDALSKEYPASDGYVVRDVQEDDEEK